MAQQQRSTSIGIGSIGSNVLKGLNWVKIVIYLIIFYVIYAVIVSVIRFLSPIFKALKDFFGGPDASKPGITGAPWWAYVGMILYLLPAGALGIAGAKASELVKKYQYHNPDLSLAEIAKRTHYTEAELIAERAKPENKDLTENEFSAKYFREATKILVEYTNAKAANAAAAAQDAQDAGDTATANEKRQEAKDALAEAKDLEETGNAEADKIEGIK